MPPAFFLSPHYVLKRSCPVLGVMAGGWLFLFFSSLLLLLPLVPCCSRARRAAYSPIFRHPGRPGSVDVAVDDGDADAAAAAAAAASGTAGGGRRGRRGKVADALGEDDGVHEADPGVHVLAAPR